MIKNKKGRHKRNMSKGSKSVNHRTTKHQFRNMLPPLTYLPVWCVYTTGVYLQNFICIGAGDCRFACFLVLLAKYMSDPVPAASQSNSIGDTFAIVSVRNNAQLLSD